MVEAMILLDSPGPLPVKATFQAPADGSVMFCLSGTAYTLLSSGAVAITLSLDGVVIGQPATCWASISYAVNPSAHYAVRTTFIAFNNLTPGEHTISVAPLSGSPTVTDNTDTFQVTLFY